MDTSEELERWRGCSPSTCEAVLLLLLLYTIVDEVGVLL